VPELLSSVPGVALAIYAHPDDADVACAGTLARWAKAGCAVHLVVCTDGGKGSRDAELSEAQLVARRAEESAEAAAIVGVASHENLGLTDGELVNSSELRAALVGWIRRVRPDAVFGHDPTAVFFAQHYFNHHDHRELGWALLDALAPAAALPHYYPEQGPAHSVPVAYLSGTLEPDVFVDVSESVDVKVAAVACHRSQLPEDGDWAEDVVRSRAAEEGARAGVAYAEGFRRLIFGP
jgi:LmbE family N-acetylglucosaminyl deacetylase